MRDQTLADDIPNIPSNIHKLALLTFSVAEKTYGLSIADIVQIIEMVSITSLPEAPPSIQGVINVRGTIVPVMDLRLRFGLTFQPYQLHTPIILANFEDITLGLVVDKVEEVLEVSPADLETNEAVIPPELVDAQDESSQISCLSGVAKVERRLIPILNSKAFLSPDEQVQLMLAMLDDHIAGIE